MLLRGRPQRYFFLSASRSRQDVCWCAVLAVSSVASVLFYGLRSALAHAARRMQPEPLLALQPTNLGSLQALLGALDGRGYGRTPPNVGPRLIPQEIFSPIPAMTSFQKGTPVGSRPRSSFTECCYRLYTACYCSELSRFLPANRGRQS